MAEPSVQNQSQPRRAARPNHSRRRPYGRGGKGGAKSTPVSTHAASSSSAPNANASTESGENKQDDSAAQTQMDPQLDESQDQDLCWICAEPIKYYAVSECNHRTCHVCALRLRALYKKLDCTFCKVRIASALHRANGLLTDECKERQPTVIFTVSPDAPFSSYTPENTPFKDEKLAISFETEEMMQDSLVLLRFNCPDSSCDHVATGWNDLKLHVRGVHKKFMWCAPICPRLSIIVRIHSTVTSASATRKSSHTNMRCTLPPSTSLIFPPPNVDNRRACQKNRLRVVYIPSASSAMNASSATKSCTITCDIRTKNVLYASETKSGTNSKPHSRPSLPH
jgi:Zinc finger, C3HC4 type (RING finger)